MPFHSAEWISEFTSIVLQSFAFWKLREPRSLRYLLAWLTLGNLIAIATHNHLALYGYTLWAGRYLAIWGWLWVAGDVISMHGRAHLSLRLPVVVAVLAAYQFAPFWSPSAENIILDSYRAVFLLVAVGILVIGTILTVPAGADPRLAIGLSMCLVAEATAAASTAVLGWAPQVQMFAWAVAMIALGVVAANLRYSAGASGNRPLPPEPPGHLSGPGRPSAQ